MLSRLNHDTPAVYFPDQWADELKQILLNTYGENCIDSERTFEVYGFSYPTEALMIISYVGLDKFETPVTLFLSSDLNEKTDIKKIMNIMFDASGMFFDDYFAKMNAIAGNEDEIFDDYITTWSEAEFSKSNIFYKISRENVGLTIQTNILLGE